MRRPTVLLLFFLFTFACMNHTPHYEYADGNANLYTISPTALAYVPVKPEESSSGLYSGGEPKAMSLTPPQFDSLRKLLERAINNPAIHMKDRVKMSGAISVIDGHEIKQYILKPGSTELAAIDALLKEMLLTPTRSARHPSP